MNNINNITIPQTVKNNYEIIKNKDIQNIIQYIEYVINDNEELIVKINNNQNYKININEIINKYNKINPINKYSLKEKINIIKTIISIYKTKKWNLKYEIITEDKYMENYIYITFLPLTI